MSIFSDEYAPFGPGQLAPIRSLKDAELLKRLRGYKRQVAKRYQIVKPPRLGRDLMGDKFWVSTKVDGQLWFLIKREGEVAMVAYNGRVLRGIALTDEAEKHLAGLDDCVIPGELFATGGEGRPTFHHVARVLGDGDQSKRLGFKAFDVVEIDQEDWFEKAYSERYDKLETIFAKGKRAGLVKTVIIEKPEEAVACYQDWVASKRAEGLVIRGESRVTYKCKPVVSLDLVVLAYGERRAPDVGQIREITVGVMRDDGSFQIAGTVGSGFSDQDRLDWFERLSGMEAESGFRLANKEGTLCRFVRPEIVVEVKVTDLMAFDADDSSIRKMVLTFNDGSYQPTGLMPTLSLVHPTLIREREDKTVDPDNVGVEQLWKVVPFDNPHGSAEETSLPETSVVERAVYTKVSRGSTMVRKYVALKTNKRDIDPRFPHYVTYFTDFSANRKDPLKTSLVVASNEETQRAQIEKWIGTNIKKGWAEHT